MSPPCYTLRYSRGSIVCLNTIHEKQDSHSKDPLSFLAPRNHIVPQSSATYSTYPSDPKHKCIQVKTLLNTAKTIKDIHQSHFQENLFQMLQASNNKIRTSDVLTSNKKSKKKKIFRFNKRTTRKPDSKRRLNEKKMGVSWTHTCVN